MRLITIAAAAAAALSLAACNQNDEQGAGEELEAAGGTVAQETEELAGEAEQGLEAAGENVEEAADGENTVE